MPEHPPGARVVSPYPEEEEFDNGTSVGPFLSLDSDDSDMSIWSRVYSYDPCKRPRSLEHLLVFE